MLPLPVSREELDEATVILLNVLVGPVELQRFQIFFSRLLEVTVRFPRNGEIVVRHGILRIDLHCALKTKERLAPQIHPGHLHAEIVLGLWLLQVLMVRASDRESDQRHEREQPVRPRHGGAP